jgi:hypothetical protein
MLGSRALQLGTQQEQSVVFTLLLLGQMLQCHTASKARITVVSVHDNNVWYGAIAFTGGLHDSSV